MAKQCILVVEDHQLLLEAIRDLLEVCRIFAGVHRGQMGTPPSNHGGCAARFDCLADIMMPQMDGYTPLSEG
jgi:CheY-like chemotaxis protein